MANYTDDELQDMDRESIKDVFKVNFKAHLTRILELDVNRSAEDINNKTVGQTLEKVNDVAIFFGQGYFANNDLSLWVLTHCSRLQQLDVQVGQQKCFMELLRECNADSEAGKKLGCIKGLAAHTGHKISQYLLMMTVVMNADDDITAGVDRFSDFERLLPFLKDTIKWEGQTEDFGVVYDRIIVLLKQAPKNFNLVKHFVGRNRRKEKESDVVDNFLRAISKLEILLSCPLLPDITRLSTDTRSLDWLTEQVRLVENSVYGRFEKYVGDRFRKVGMDGETYEQMKSTIEQMWKDLEEKVQVDEESAPSTGDGTQANQNLP